MAGVEDGIEEVKDDSKHVRVSFILLSSSSASSTIFLFVSVNSSKHLF